MGRRLLTVLGALTLLAVVPPAALATGTTPVPSSAPGSNPLGNPITPGLPQSPASTPTTTTTPVPTTTIGGSSSSSSSGLSGTSALIIVLGAVVLLCGISYFIWRDARRRAPVRSYAAAVSDSRRAGSKRQAKPRKLSPAERRRRKRGRARK